MIELDELSLIGFGGYRISESNKEHQAALYSALQAGCNLLDTSSNYTDGGSERLIGEVLAAQPNRSVFIISKAGYIQGGIIDEIKYLNSKNLALQNLVKTSTGFMHSIHPDFLKDQLTRSLERLGRKQLDAFLLHNPEHYFSGITHDSPTSEAEYYQRIALAFDFLEEQVHLGKIRYYGISSNTFPLHPSKKNSTNLNTLIKLAQNSASSHHFKFIQFPFNFSENEALINHNAQPSLLATAKASKIISLGNRPFNMQTADGVIELGAFQKTYPTRYFEEDREIVNGIFTRIQNHLNFSGLECNIFDIKILNYLDKNWSCIGNTQATDKIYEQYFFPFINEIFGSNISEENAKIFKSLYELSYIYSQINVAKKARYYLEDLHKRKLINLDSSIPIQTQVCQYYINSGVDHILMGLRKPDYVESVKSLMR